MDDHQDRLMKEIEEWDNRYAVELYERSMMINPFPKANAKAPKIDRIMWEVIRDLYSLMEEKDEFRDLYAVFNKYWWQESIGRYFRFMQKPAGKKAEWKKVEYKKCDILEKFDAIKGAVKEWHEEAAEHNGENTSGMLNVKLHSTLMLDKPGMTSEIWPSDIIEYVRPYLK